MCVISSTHVFTVMYCEHIHCFMVYLKKNTPDTKDVPSAKDILRMHMQIVGRCDMISHI